MAASKTTENPSIKIPAQKAPKKTVHMIAEKEVSSGSDLENPWPLICVHSKVLDIEDPEYSADDAGGDEDEEEEEENEGEEEEADAEVKLDQQEEEEEEEEEEEANFPVPKKRKQRL